MGVFKVGVIGLGVGEQHIISYQNLPNIEVKAVCDVNKKKLEEVSFRRNIKYKFEDYRYITEDPEISAVSICSYDNCHVEQAISAFNNGKHVFIEKPIALSKNESSDLYKSYIKSKKIISSNLILRTEPRFKLIKKMIEKGDFGKIISIEGDYIHNILWKITQGWRGQMKFYSVVFGGGIHLIDLMRWLLNAEVTSVSSISNKILTKDTEYKYDDCFYSLLKFDNDTIGKSATSYGPIRSKFHSLNIYGSKKSFVNDRPYGKLFSGIDEKDKKMIKIKYPAHNKGDLIPNFIDSIRKNIRPEVSSEDIFRVMDVCFAIEKSAKSLKNEKILYTV